MVKQAFVDRLADFLVEQGVLVTVDALRDALRRDGAEAGDGASARELHALLADWKRRRRYHGHLAVLDLSEELERTLATVAMALGVTRTQVGRDVEPAASGSVGARHPAGLLDPIQERLAAMADDIGALREQVGELALSRSRTKPPPKAKREGRKRGLAAVMGRYFWDQVMQHFVEAIRRGGPMTAADLLATLDQDVRDMAEGAFERIDLSLIAEKVDERVKRGKHFRKGPDGRYDLA